MLYNLWWRDQAANGGVPAGNTAGQFWPSSPTVRVLVGIAIAYIHGEKIFVVCSFTENAWYFPSFLQILLTSSPYISASFSKNAAKTVWPLSSCNPKNSNRGALCRIDWVQSWVWIRIGMRWLATQVSQCLDPANGADLTGSGSSTLYDKCLGLAKLTLFCENYPGNVCVYCVM